MSPGHLALTVLACWTFALAGRAQGPNYDAFSEKDGDIATKQQEAAAWALVQNPVQLEAVYADAGKGNVRAQHVWQELEATFAASGVGLAEKATRPDCLVPSYRELSKQCVPIWTFLDFLATAKPGANRLREVTFRAFAIRAHERGMENRLILTAASGLVAVAVAAAVLREAEVVAEAQAIDPNRLNHIFGKAEHALDDLVRKCGGPEQAFRRIQEAANKALREGRLTVGPNGELPTGNAGNVIDVDGMPVRLIGGRVVDGAVRIATASRKGLP